MYRSAALLVFVMMSSCGKSDLRLASTMSNHMVLQREVGIPIRGTAIPDSRVTVQLNGQKRTVRANDSGKWKLMLPPMDAGGPHVMTVKSGKERIDVVDVLIGDVWLASGQSNIEWVVSNSNGATDAIQLATDSQIRHLKVPRSWSFSEQDSLAGGAWQVASPDTVGSFSAVGYYFAQNIRESVGIPIGIVNSSWGGSRIEPWMSADALGMSQEAQARLVAAEQQRILEIQERLEELIGEFPDRDSGLVDGVAIWAQPDYDDVSWTEIDVHVSWEQQGYVGLDGIAWYRTTFDLTASEASAGVALGVGAIDDSDSTFVNGTLVGATDQAAGEARRYDVAAGVLRTGRNTLAVRVRDSGGDGGIVGDSTQTFVESGAQRRLLTGTWRFKVGQASISRDSGKNKIATLLYNAMVHPLIDTPIKGVIWYQGESNTNSPADALEYSEHFRTMIASWRDDWRQDEMPFIWVQLANFLAPDSEPAATSTWAILRESQSDALALPNTGQAVVIDIGEADDIHPRNKRDVGRRLALAARHVAYGEDLVYSGPTYASHEIRGDRVIISFDHVGGGLVGARDGSVGGFSIAGADGKFYWAEARIGGETIAVWSGSVAAPVAVRYGWANNPDRANLYNREGLPASPFRTDRPE